MLIVEDVAPGVRALTLNRPSRMNAFDGAQYVEATDALDACGRDCEVGAVVITGAAGNFSSGHDRTLLTAPESERLASSRQFHRFITALAELDVPVLAAVEGVAVGVGMTLLAYCDIVVMGASARLRAPFAQLGLAPEAGCSVTLPAIVGWHRASDYLLTGRWLGAAELVTAGFGTELVADGTAGEHAISTALAMVSGAPRASLVATKRLLREGRADGVQLARARERAAFTELLGR
jgi:enoyl-CoA hydratase/carnithine racemase